MNDIAGDKILSIIKNNNLTQKKFAEMLNVTPQAVSKWIKNISIPDIQQLIKISELFEVSIDDILTKNKVIKGKYRIIIKRKYQFYLIPSVIRVFQGDKELGVLQNNGTLVLELDNYDFELKLQLLYRRFYIKATVKGNEMIINCKLSRISGGIIASTKKATSFIGQQGTQKIFERFEKALYIIFIAGIFFFLFLLMGSIN